MFNTEEKPSSVDNRSGPSTTAPETEKDPETFRGQTLPGILIKVPLPNLEMYVRPNSRYTQRIRDKRVRWLRFCVLFVR